MAKLPVRRDGPLIPIPTGVQASPVGFRFSRKLSWEEHCQLGAALAQMDQVLAWFIGDWYLEFGSSHGEDEITQVVEDLFGIERARESIRQYAFVSSFYQLGRRLPSCSWSYHQAATGMPTAERALKLLAKIDADMKADPEGHGWTLKRVRQCVRDAKRRKPKKPTQKYRIIYADPPWQYSDELIEGYGAAEHHYPTMSLAELKELPVADWLEDDAVLFLWVTSPLLPEAESIINAWGFDYKASFVWDKVKHNYGHYNSVRHEFLLVATRGSCLPDTKKLHDSVVTLERSSRHSEKPAAFRHLIDKMYTEGKRLEMFARSQVKGWDTWGDET